MTIFTEGKTKERMSKRHPRRILKKTEYPFQPRESSVKRAIEEGIKKKQKKQEGQNENQEMFLMNGREWKSVISTD